MVEVHVVSIEVTLNVVNRSLLVADGLFQKLLIHWYFLTGTTSRCVYVFGSNIKKTLDLGKVDRDLFFCSWKQSTEPFVLLEQPRECQCRCGHFSMVMRQRVQRVIHSAERAAGCNLPSLQDVRGLQDPEASR